MKLLKNYPKVDHDTENKHNLFQSKCNLINFNRVTGLTKKKHLL